MSADKFLMWVCQKKTSNKWWTYEVNGNSVTTRWGRIGQTGQSNTKSFPSSYKRDDFIRKKTWEKTGKGYEPISKENFDLLSLQAEIMGSGNKIESTAIVLQDKKLFHEVPTQAAYDPSLELGLMVTFRLRDKHGATAPYTLMFRGDDVFDLNIEPAYYASRMKALNFRPVRSWQGSGLKVDSSHPLWGMVEKLQEVLGTTL